MKKAIYLFVIALICFFTYRACFRYEHYVFPQLDFDVVIPLSVKNYYNVDTVPSGFGINPSRTLVLRITPEEFEKYVGHFDFQKIDTSRTDIKMEYTNVGALCIINPGYDPQKKEAQRVGAVFSRENNLYYDFNFETGYIYIDDYNKLNRVIFYDPQEGVLIFYAFGHEHKYPEKMKNLTR